MDVKELDDILQKVSDLQVFLDYGMKTVPLVEDVMAFTKQIGPVVEGIRSLVDVTTQKLPKAAEQLGKVNLSSEQASTDILNAIDRMTTAINTLETSPSGSQDLGLVHKTAEKIDVLVRTVASQCAQEEDAKELNNLWDLHRQSLRTLGAGSVDQRAVETLRTEITSIMMSTQMQDITGQQIATVIGTMQALDDLLRKLLAEVFDVLHATQPQAALVADAPTITVGTDERKQLVESLLQKARAGEILAESR